MDKVYLQWLVETYCYLHLKFLKPKTTIARTTQYGDFLSNNAMCILTVYQGLESRLSGTSGGIRIAQMGSLEESNAIPFGSNPQTTLHFLSPLTELTSKNFIQPPKQRG